MNIPVDETVLGRRKWDLQYYPDEDMFKLISPFRYTVWDTASLTASDWSDDAAVEGRRGIHALRFLTVWHECTSGTVIGVVERFGRYVLGTKGWRAESVTIRELKVNTGYVRNIIGESRRFAPGVIAYKLSCYYEVPVRFGKCHVVHPTSCAASDKLSTKAIFSELDKMLE